MQVVGYERATSADRRAALLLADDGRVERRELVPGTDLDYSLGDRHCAGVVDGEVHAACDRPSAPYCDAHTSTWACARCTGQCDKPLDACEREHVVYLAAFAPDVFKVGVTRSGRLEARLREQGADRGAHVHTVSDGRIARRIEAEMATDLTDRVRVATKVRGLASPVDAGAWAALLAEHDPVRTFAFDHGLGLAERPVTATVATGRVRGVKGRLLVLDRGGTAYATDLRDLVGHEVDPGGDDRALQSSLGAFAEDG